MADDAFIDVRVVNNVLAGHGPVYNVGERVEAYTNPLWVLLLVVFRGLLPFLSVEWWAMVLGIALTAMGVFLGSSATMRFGRR
jgi:arabinofuranosyltransferase